MSPRYNEYVSWVKARMARLPGWTMLPATDDVLDTIRAAREELPPEEFQALMSLPEMSMAKSLATMDRDRHLFNEEEAHRASVIEAARQNQRARKEKLGSVEEQMGSLFERLKQNQEIIQKGKELLSRKTPAPEVPALTPPALTPPTVPAVGGGSAPTTTPLLEAASGQTAPKKKVTLHVSDPLDSIVEGPTATFTRQKTGGAGIGNGTPARTIGTTAPSTPSPTVDDLIRDLQNANLPRRISTPEVQSAIREATFPSVDVRRQEALRMLTQGALDDSRRVQRALDVVGGASESTPKLPVLWENLTSNQRAERPLTTPKSTPRLTAGPVTGAESQYSLGRSQIPHASFNSTASAPKRPVGNASPLGGGSLSPISTSFRDTSVGAQPRGTARAGTNNTSTLGGLFDNLTNESFKQKTSKSGGGWFGKGAGMKNTSGAKQRGRIFAPGIADRFSAFGANITNPQFDYNLKTGIQGWGHNIGKVGSFINTGANVIGALGEVGNMSDESQRTDDLSADILTAAMSNPLSTYGLTPDQLRLLGDIRSGRLNNSAGISDVDWGSGLRDGLTGALIGLTGGLPGAIAGGLTGLAKGGLGGLTNAKARKNAELEALYQALNQSNTNYQNAMRNRMMERYF